MFLEYLPILFRSLLACFISSDNFFASSMKSLMFVSGFLLFFSFFSTSFFSLTYDLGSIGPNRGSSGRGSDALLVLEAGILNISGSFFAILGLGW